MDDEDGYFGERVAAGYDESSAGMFEPGVVDAAVDVLAELADGGRALELGIGTGRIALPLAGRGVPVHGIDVSRAMVARLRAKPGGGAIGVGRVDPGALYQREPPARLDLGEARRLTLALAAKPLFRSARSWVA
jgi:SAM-dependent methyltransferase